MLEQTPRKTKNQFRLFIRIYRMVNRIRDRFANALGVDLERKRTIYIELSQAATLRDLVYWMQMVFAAGITMLGLILNSPAVIIGAMLISPLMNPILASGVALATGDLILGFRSLLKLFLSALLASGIAFLIVALLPFREATSEILARTEPNTLDLCIALFSGAIGSVAISREVKGIATSIPGVAIAVALMPPLCVVGYGVGVAITQNFTNGLNASTGGGLLFLTNLVAITFMAMLTFMLLRIDTSKVREKVSSWRETDRESRWWLKVIGSVPSLENARKIRSVSLRLVMIVLPLLLISIPLVQSFYKLKAQYAQQQVENQIKARANKVWDDYFGKDSSGNARSFVDELRINETSDGLDVYMRVFNDTAYTPAEIASYKRLLAAALNRDLDTVTFQLVQIPTSARQSIQPTVVETPPPPTVAEIQTNYLQSVQSKISDLKLPAPAALLDYRIINSQSAPPLLEVFYLSERDLSEDARQILADDVKTRMTLPDLLVEFERISAEPNEIPFEENSAQISSENGGIWQTVGAVMQQHPNLNLAVVLNADTNEELRNQRRQAIMNALKQSWSIEENRFVFSDGENNTFQLFLSK